MAFDPITPLPGLPTKPDAESDLWNTRYLEIDALFNILENVTGTTFWNGVDFSTPAGTSDGHVINDEGTPLAQQVNLDFIGASVAAADNGGNTEVTINGAVLAKNIEALSGNKTLTDASEPIQILTPDAARDVNLPAEAVTNPFFLITNPSGSGFTLTIKDDSPATITTVADGETKLIVPDGVTWYVLAGGGGGGATVFTDLTDTPASYSGEALKLTRVNAGETALEFVTDASLVSPLTTKGDVLGYDTDDNRIPVGSNTQVLTADSAQTLGLKWATPFISPLTTKGDLHGYEADDARLPVGADGLFLKADSGETPGLKWDTVAPGKHTVYIPASFLRPATTNGCGQLSAIELVAQQPEIDALPFDGTAKEYAVFGLRFPKKWNNGTLTWRPSWTSIATDTGGVAWGLQARAADDGQAVAGVFGTAAEVVDVAQSASRLQYRGDESSALTIANSPVEGSKIRFTLYRDPDNGSDNHEEDADFDGLELFYTTDAENDD